MAVRFEILERRDDTSYHYKRYEDNKFIREGNGFYSNLTTDEEQTAWVNAVVEWQTANNINTPSKKVKDAIQKVRDRLTLDDQQFGEPKSLVMPSLASVMELLSSGKCDDTYIQQLLDACGSEVPTPKNIIHYAFDATVDNLKLELQKLKYQITSLGINGFVIPVLDAVEAIVDSFFTQIDAIYDELLRMYAQAFYYYKKACTFKERLSDIEIRDFFQNLVDELKRIGKEIGQKIVDLLYTCFLVPLVQEIIETIQNIAQTSADVWQTLKSKLQSITTDDIKEVLGDIGKGLLDALIALLPLIGTLIGALLALQCSNNEEGNVADSATQNSAKIIADAEGDSYDSSIDKNYFRNKAIEKQNEIKEKAIVYSYALDTSWGYSLFPIENSNNLNNLTSNYSTNFSNETGFPCQITMCEDETPTNTSALFDESNLRGASRVIVEFSSNIKNLEIYYSEGQQIHVDDVIATIDGINVKSKIDCSVSEAYSTYFVANYTTPSFTENITDVSLFSEQYNSYVTNLYDTQTATTSPFEELVQKYQNASYVYEFIKDYISFFRFPELAAFTREHTSADAVAISTERFVEEYETAAEKIIEDFEENLQRTFNQDYVKQAAEKGKLIEIKDKADAERQNLISQILTFYDANPGEMTCCSQGRIQDFMLYSYYINYLYSDRFVYDEDNPYIVELYNAITDFIVTRRNIELNSWNIQGLIDKFNELCNEVLYQYWQVDITYYAKLKELFTGNVVVYTLSDSNTKVNDPTSSTVYKKVLDYLKALTKYTEPVQQEITYKEGTDINEFLQQQSNISTSSIINQDSLVLERKLKKIAYQFITLLKIETSPTESDNVPNFYVGSETHKYLEALYLTNQNMMNHTEGERYSILSSLKGKEEILDDYLQELKITTAKEVVRLRSIVKRATDWFYTNDEELTSCSVFNQYREINWPASSIIFKDNVQCDYYLFDDVSANAAKTFMTPEEMRNIEIPLEAVSKDIPGIGTAEQLNTASLPMSEYGIDSIMYWLKYCTVATLVNCMMPIYWSTGLIIAGVPVLLPIIYIPFCVIPGRITTVIGIGLCGIMPSPMVLFVNPSPMSGCILIPLNMIVDMIVKQLNSLREKQYKTIEITLQPLINSLDQQINNYKSQLQDLNYQIEQVKAVNLDFRTNKALKKRKNKDTTMKTTVKLNM